MQKLTILLSFTLLFKSILIAQNPGPYFGLFRLYNDSTELNRDIQALCNDFIARVKAVNPEIDFRTAVVVYSSSLLTHFSPPDDEARIPLWQDVPSCIHDELKNLEGTKEAAQHVFAHLFNGFYIPHELVHGLQKTFRGMNDFSDAWMMEYEANELTIYYLLSLGTYDDQLNNVYDSSKRWLSILPDPVPPGQEKGAYLTENYARIAQELDVRPYAWLHSWQIVDIMKKEKKPSFEAYLRSFFEKD
ncbi:MAG: hypothetical protein ACK4VN_15385 [Bacteroidales bacterium]